MSRLSVFRRLACAGAFASVISCGDSGSVVDAGGNDAIDGLQFSSTVALIDGGGGYETIKLVSIRVVITNTSDQVTTRHYPAGCPVRLRLYELGGAGSLVYDESQEPCNVNATVSFTLQPGASVVLSSTPHFPWEVGGDSLRVGPYEAAGMVRITGENPFELPAGRYDLPLCVVITPPGGGLPFTECQ